MTVLEQVRRADLQIRAELLEDVVHRVVEVADPERIVLFGSVARGDMRSRSDLDLLVVKDGDYDYHRLISALYRTLARIEPEVDVVLVTSAQAERYRKSHCLVIHPALKEGKVIYERAALRT
jgi:predicted nucleotidyltransferase